MEDDDNNCGTVCENRITITILSGFSERAIDERKDKIERQATTVDILFEVPFLYCSIRSTSSACFDGGANDNAQLAMGWDGVGMADKTRGPAAASNP